ncbi:MAG: mucoidy inhibitor MuiA family protein [Peptococcaceae bacterium]|nr:mucoidy inhibitor MuiA family protein [Peptococcaceae bacterium]
MKNLTSTSIPVDSRISNVVVYLSGAQVTRTADIETPADSLSVVFSRLPGTLHPESIQVSVTDGTVIHSVEHATNYLQETDHTEEITALKEQLKTLERRLIKENNQVELGTLEEKMFARNMDLAGSKTGLKADELKAAVLFYNERMSAVRETRLSCQERIDDLNKQITALKTQLGSFNRNRARPEPVSEITVTLAANESSEDTTSPKTLTLSYFVDTAGWQPSYDIRANNAFGDIALHYKGKVSQNSGENWENVRLTLSTGNPGINAVCPDLKPWYVDLPLYQPRVLASGVARGRSRAPGLSDEINGEDSGHMYLEQSEATGEPFETATASASLLTAAVSESVTSAEYNLTPPYTIASGDDGQDVEITTHSLAAAYRYFSVSKLEREVFLLAAVREWEHLHLIAGEASIFFENRYVGKTMIDPRRAEETIDLSLGTDKSVIVTRERGKDRTGKTLVGGNIKQTRQWELTARNLKPYPIEIELKDQVPVSINKQINVSVIDMDGATMDADTGILTWKITLNPAEAKTMTMKYVVTSPKETPVYLD